MCGAITLDTVVSALEKPSVTVPVRALARALNGAGAAAPARQAPTTALMKKARAIHDRVITLDTHNDINPANFTAERNYTQRLDTQVNLPKMVEGGLDAVLLHRLRRPGR